MRAKANWLCTALFSALGLAGCCSAGLSGAQLDRLHRTVPESAQLVCASDSSGSGGGEEMSYPLALRVALDAVADRDAALDDREREMHAFKESALRKLGEAAAGSEKSRAAIRALGGALGLAADADDATLCGAIAAVARKLSAEGDSRREVERMVEALRQAFKAVLRADQLLLVEADNTLVLRLSSDALFATGSAELSRDGQALLEGIAPILVKLPTRRYVVVGHTDDKKYPRGSKMTNQLLGLQRASRAVAALAAHGLPEGRLVATSMGANAPLDSSGSEEARARNRRIEIELIQDLLDPRSLVALLLRWGI
ncbi:MAG TPA: OmpA family protein [Myxococcota bacterium]|nr:OmpA family protein [Myxococcota bacterium]HRY93667.1 OmpA family protein [Myxococcota bacterium]